VIIVATDSVETQLALAIRVERTAERLYRLLAERFADAPEEHALFLRLAAEEAEHALRLELLGTTLARKPGARLHLDVERTERALREGEVLATLLAPPHPRPPRAEARRLAARLEERFAQVHAHQLAGQDDPDLREFFRVFVNQDRAHAALLRGVTGQGE
jgi:rubrerythrin